MKLLKKTITMILGNFLLALGICAFILPLGIITGGGTGIGLIIKHFANIEVSTTIFVINIIMFIIGYIVLGKEFSLGTIVSSILFPTFVSILEKVEMFNYLTEDVLLSSIYAGICIGVGMGLVLREGASTGGLDIPPLILNKYTGISIGVFINVVDGIILLGQIFFSSIEQTLYGILVVVISATIIDKLMLLGSTQVQVTIISKEYDSIKNIVFDKIGRGCTFLNITTGYEQINQQAVMVVVSKRQLHILNELILDIDPIAFIISNETHSVKGRGFSLPSVDK